MTTHVIYVLHVQIIRNFQFDFYLDDIGATEEEKKWAALSAIADCIMRVCREKGILTVIHDVGRSMHCCLTYFCNVWEGLYKCFDFQL